MEVEIVHNRREGIGVTIDCPSRDERVERLKKHIEQFDNRIKGNMDGKLCFVDVKDIFYFDSVDNRTFLYTQNQCVEVMFRLYELEDMLAERDFIRISKSQIVNIQKIKSLMPQMNRTLLITMNNEERLCISRRYVKSMKDKLGI